MMEYQPIQDKAALQALFENPDARYRGKPFWSWNGELEKDELIRQVGVMKEMGLGGFFMHSRAGLITEYLSEEWFSLINAVADAGEACGMEAWLYDEDRWPSGSAGGKVTVDPQYRMKSLVIYETPLERFIWNDQTYLAYLADLNDVHMYSYRPIAREDDISALTAAAPSGTWKILEFRIVPDACSSNYNGTTYIDTMSDKAVRRFIELTHEEYRKHCGDRLGRSIKGIFSDEPHRGHAMDNRAAHDGVISCSMCWTDDLFEEFERRYGYDAKRVLPELFYRLNGNPVARIKLHYLDLACNLFIERFAMPINEWCQKNGIEFTGHVLHEDSLSNQTVPNGSLMRFYEHMGYPGIDVLAEGNCCYWAAKQLDSAARQLGRKWKLSELYGCTGWQFNLKSHKAVGDWQALFGVNLRCHHLSWYTMEGESKRDYPASILHQSPWWKDYGYVEDYFSRFGVILSEGQIRCDVLVLNPIESVWCQTYLGWAAWISGLSPDIQRLEHQYGALFHMLVDNHIDFDYGEEEMMSRMARIEKTADGTPLLYVGHTAYKTVVVGGMITMRPSTVALLETFIEAGGKVVFAGDVPQYVDASPSKAVCELSEKAITTPFEEAALVAAVDGFLSISDKAVYARTVRYPELKRTAVVLLNTDREQGRDEIVIRYEEPEFTIQAVEEWNLETGARVNRTACAVVEGNAVTIRTPMNAAGTRVFMLMEEISDAPIMEENTLMETISAPRDLLLSYTLDEPNVCVLDFARWRWQGGEWHPEQEVLKADREIRHSIGIECRGGEMLQPWFAKLHDKQIYGTLELEYEFYADVLPQTDVILAGERPEYNEYYLNGTRLTCPDPHDFWVDNAFQKMPVSAGLLKKGRNIVTVKTQFMRTTNVEALYLLGDFGVALNGRQRTLTALPEKIGFNATTAYQLPFYTGCITYHLTPELYGNITLKENERAVLTPDAFTGGLIKVNGAVIAWEPYEADVTERIRHKRSIDVTLVGTRRNTFGPLHLVPAIHGAYGPGHFVTEGGAWTNEYNLIGSGITGLTIQKYRCQ